MNDRNLFLTVLKTIKAKIEVLEDSVPSKGLLLEGEVAPSMCSNIVEGQKRGSNTLMLLL
jgi:hypothetical protein